MRNSEIQIQLMIAFFAAVNHNYGDSQQTMKSETNKMDRNPPITTNNHDFLTGLKWTSVSREVSLGDSWQQKV